MLIASSVKKLAIYCSTFLAIRSRMDRASATEVVDWGLIPEQLTTIKVGIHNLHA